MDAQTLWLKVRCCREGGTGLPNEGRVDHDNNVQLALRTTITVRFCENARPAYCYAVVRSDTATGEGD